MNIIFLNFCKNYYIYLHKNVFEDESITLDGDGAATTLAVAVDVQSDEEDDEEEEEDSSVGSRSLGSSTDSDDKESKNIPQTDEPMDTSSGDAAMKFDGGADANATNSAVEGSCDY